MSDSDPHADTRAAEPSDSDKAAEFFKEWERLRNVALSELRNPGHGTFIISFLKAYCSADWQNAELMTPAFQALEGKYKLVDHFAALKLPKTPDQTAGEPGVT